MRSFDMSSTARSKSLAHRVLVATEHRSFKGMRATAHFFGSNVRMRTKRCAPTKRIADHDYNFTDM
ncbi:MAG: hypothetical protein AB1586_17935 [Pseudomonadota bacterium]|jgi:hypothetical protein